MHRNGQGLFLPRAKLKQREKEQFFFLHSSDLYAEKIKVDLYSIAKRLRLKYFFDMFNCFTLTKWW